MIINIETKSVEMQSHRRQDENWMGEGWLVIPPQFENVILSNAPNIDLVIENEQIMDVNIIEVKPTEEELKQKYEQKTQQLIAIKYPPNEENKVIREYLAYPNDETKKKAFNDYNSYVEECKLNAKTEIYKQK